MVGGTGSNQWPLPCEQSSGAYGINDMEPGSQIATRTCYNVMSFDITQCSTRGALSRIVPSGCLERERFPIKQPPSTNWSFHLPATLLVAAGAPGDFFGLAGLADLRERRQSGGGVSRSILCPPRSAGRKVAFQKNVAPPDPSESDPMRPKRRRSGFWAHRCGDPQRNHDRPLRRPRMSRSPGG